MDANIMSAPPTRQRERGAVNDEPQPHAIPALSASSGVQYTRLPDNCIRLLTLKPASSKKRLSCRLDIYELDVAPEYEALSYCWGPPVPKIRITCDKRPAEITSNLHDALMALRQRRRPRVIWADQLCIWQSDAQEKSAQVRRMDQIFGRATRVVMWVGMFVNRDETSRAEQLADLFGRIARVPETYMRYLPINLRPFQADDALARLSLPLIAHPIWKVVAFFMGMPYFKRSWIAQEVFTAKSCHLLWCGVHIPWANVLAAASFVSDRPFIWVGALLSALVAAPGLRHVQNLGATSKIPFHTLVSHSRYREATDDRDRLFSLLSMADEPPTIVRVDYELSEEQVFAQAAVQILNNTGRVDFLVYNHSIYLKHPQAKQWASWIPKWRHEDLMLECPGMPNADDGEAAQHWRFDAFATELTLRGLEYTTVKDFIPPAVFDSMPYPEDERQSRRCIIFIVGNWHALFAEEIIRKNYMSTDHALCTLQAYFEYFLCSNNVLSNLGGPFKWTPRFFLAIAHDLVEGVQLSASDQRDTQAKNRQVLEHEILLSLAELAVIAYLDPRKLKGGTYIVPLSLIVRKHFLQNDIQCEDGLVTNVLASSHLSQIKPRGFEHFTCDGTTIERARAIMQGSRRGDLPRFRMGLINMHANLVLWDRWPCRTANGQLCIGPREMQVDDVVAVVFGCNKPLLLRQVARGNNLYRSVGECFVPHMMQGELVKKLRKERKLESSLQDFRLV